MSRDEGPDRGGRPPVEEPAATAKDGMGSAQGDEPAREVEQWLVDVVPVEPGELRVVAVGVVVAGLGAAQLVSAEQHGHALREEQGGQQVALLARSQRQDGVIVGGTSTPQFQERLYDSPSRSPSPLAPLCLRS